MGSQPAQRSIEQAIARLAGRQNGVVDRSQLIGLGLGSSCIDHRVAVQRLHVMWRGVYAVGHREVSRRGRLRAAVMACGPGATLSHGSAAELWRLIQPQSGPIHVTVPKRAGRSRRKGLVVHRAPLPAPDVIVLDGIRVTAVPRTVIDFAATRPRRAIERALDEAQFLDRLHRDAVDAALARNAGRPGAGVLAVILAKHTPGSTRTRSGVEERFLGMCRRDGLDDPEVNADCEGFLVDFLWRDARVLVEVDSRAAHEKSSSFDSDRARDLELRAAGYEVLRFSEDHLYEREQWVMAHLKRALGLAERTVS